MSRLTPPPVRCAIYTRKSTEEGLEQAFNSLDAQREACAAYVMSQQHEGWTLLPDYYDDGGISGGTMDRPAMQRLLEALRQRINGLDASGAQAAYTRLNAGLTRLLPA